MTFPSGRVAIVCTLAISTATLATPALADDIDLSSNRSAPITGLAWDAETEEVITVDERGDILAVDADAGTSRPVTFTGQAESVQGLSMFEDLLYIGDVGDSEGSREFVTVYRVDPASRVTTYRAWDFRYPEGPRDAKALALSGRGRIYIVTDGEDPGIYRAGPQPSRTGVNQLERAADAPEGVTDAVFLEDGSTLMLRSATGVELVDASTWERGAVTTYVDAPPAESITTYGEDRMLVGDGDYLRDEPLPEGRTTVTPGPAAESTPAPSPSATPSEPPELTEEVIVETEPAVSRRGTVLALLGAGAVALLAGIVVFVVRD